MRRLTRASIRVSSRARSAAFGSRSKSGLEPVDRQAQRLQHHERRLVDGIGRAVAIGQPRGAEAAHREPEEFTQGDRERVCWRRACRPRLPDMNRRAFLIASLLASTPLASGACAARRSHGGLCRRPGLPALHAVEDHAEGALARLARVPQGGWVEVDPPRLKDAYQRALLAGRAPAGARAASAQERHAALPDRQGRQDRVQRVRHQPLGDDDDRPQETFGRIECPALSTAWWSST